MIPISFGNQLGLDQSCLPSLVVTFALITMTAGTVMIADAHGTVVAHTRFAPLAAPVDLLPKVTTVRLTLPASAIGQPLSVGLALDGAPAEITLANNRQPLPNVPGRKR